MKLIVTSDWHLRTEKPRCRIDEDWIQTQNKVLDFVFKTAVENDADIAVVGDVFDLPIVHPKLVNMILEKINIAWQTSVKNNFKFYIIAGQHDLPHHRFEDIDNSSFGTLWKSGKVKGLGNIGTAFHFGTEKELNKLDEKIKNEFVFLHTLTFPHSDEIPPFIKDAVGANQLLKKYPAKYICTGDNHHGFIYEDEYRYVINPGCLTIQTSDMINYQPFIVLIDTEKEMVKKIFVPSDSEYVTDEYIKENEKRDERIESFVESIATAGKLSLSFEDNLNKAIERNKNELGEETIDIITEIMEETK